MSGTVAGTERLCHPSPAAACGEVTCKGPTVDQQQLQMRMDSGKDKRMQIKVGRGTLTWRVAGLVPQEAHKPLCEKDRGPQQKMWHVQSRWGSLELER